MENNDGRKILLGLSHDELKAVVRDLGMPSFTAGQILKWLYQQHVLSIDEMTNISKTNRERLKEHFVVGAMAPIDSQHSSDGTIKYLFPVCCHGMLSASLRLSLSPMASGLRFVFRARWVVR